MEGKKAATHTLFAGSAKIEYKAGLLDINGVERVELQIGSCGSTIWIHTEGGTQVRIRQEAGPIPIKVCDERFPERVMAWPDPFPQATRRPPKP